MNLVGGDLEFASKRLPGTRDGVYWLYGDCNKTELQAHEVIEGLERAKIPIEEGTLVCFSNYQLVHRVLRMELASDQGENKTQNLGYRDFLAFFVIDQRRPLVSFPDIHTTSSKGVERGTVFSTGLSFKIFEINFYTNNFDPQGLAYTMPSIRLGTAQCLFGFSQRGSHASV